MPRDSLGRYAARRRPRRRAGIPYTGPITGEEVAGVVSGPVVTLGGTARELAGERSDTPLSDAIEKSRTSSKR